MSDQQAPQMVNRQLAQEAIAWLEALTKAGLLVFDSKGVAMLPPKVRELATSLHEVLAGGEVRVTVVTPGDIKRRSELDGKLEQAMTAVNKVNAAFGPEALTP